MFKPFCWRWAKGYITFPICSQVYLNRFIEGRPRCMHPSLNTASYVCVCPGSRRASILVASAFHPSYGEKMIACAETATSFKGCLIVRKGLEGKDVHMEQIIVEIFRSGCAQMRCPFHRFFFFSGQLHPSLPYMICST